MVHFNDKIVTFILQLFQSFPKTRVLEYKVISFVSYLLFIFTILLFYFVLFFNRYPYLPKNLSYQSLPEWLTIENSGFIPFPPLYSVIPPSCKICLCLSGTYLRLRPCMNLNFSYSSGQPISRLFFLYSSLSDHPNLISVFLRSPGSPETENGHTWWSGHSLITKFNKIGV